MGLYFRTGLLGGSAGNLDNISGDSLADSDVSLTYESGEVQFHYLDEDSGATENSPSIISPDDSPGNKRWRLCDLAVNDLKCYGNILPGDSVQELIGSGEISTAVPVTEFKANGVNLLTIGSGENNGQLKYVCMVSGESETNYGILSGNNFAGTSLVFGHNGDAAALIWTSDGKWNYLGAAQYTP